MSEYNDWANSVTTGFEEARRGNYDQALAHYHEADAFSVDWEEQGIGVTQCAPELSLLRHVQGSINAPSLVRVPDPTEDLVIGMRFEAGRGEHFTADGMTPVEINPQVMHDNLNAYRYNSHFHGENIKDELEHLFVMSTGRVGTVSLLKLLQRTHYYPQHTFMITVCNMDRLNMMCRFMSGDFTQADAEENWVQTRAAEWLGPMSFGRPAAFLNHTDTIFAPVFAQIHPKAKFLFLHRDPEDIFGSLYAKDQFLGQQLRSVHYSFTPEFNYKRMGYDIPGEIAWYIKFHEVFCREFGKIMGGRFIEINSNELFNGSITEQAKLRAFTNIDLGMDEIAQHYQTPYNAKAHKNKIDSSVGIDSFRRMYDSLQ